MAVLEKILIVDDDETSNFITELILKSSNMVEAIETLSNGKDAIDYFSSNENKLPDLVFLDINMPLVDGFEFLEWYERKGYIGKCKFALYSTSTRKADKQRATQFIDVIGYIEKPINLELLRNLCDKIERNGG